MEVIQKDGKVIQQSRNLRGIRRYVGSHIIKELQIASQINGSTGWLYIIFEDGSTFQTDFASFSVLQNFVRSWRNTYGAPLWMNGHEAGKVSYHNPNLNNRRKCLQTQGVSDMYKIVRSYFNRGSQGGGSTRRTIKTGLTLEQAQAHCQDKETSSSTGTGAAARRRTKRYGQWFDRYEECKR